MASIRAGDEFGAERLLVPVPASAWLGHPLRAGRGRGRTPSSSRAIGGSRGTRATASVLTGLFAGACHRRVRGPPYHRLARRPRVRAGVGVRIGRYGDRALGSSVGLGAGRVHAARRPRPGPLLLALARVGSGVGSGAVPAGLQAVAVVAVITGIGSAVVRRSRWHKHPPWTPSGPGVVQRSRTAGTSQRLRGP